MHYPVSVSTDAEANGTGTQWIMHCFYVGMESDIAAVCFRHVLTSVVINSKTVIVNN